MPRIDRETPSVIAIGASTGGPPVFLQILQALPKKFPVPIVAVQHVAEGFMNSLVGWLQQHCRVKVKLAEKGERICRGTVYFAPEGYHLEVNSSGIIALSSAPPQAGHRPSIDLTFQSLCCFSPCCWAFLLTGMGKDGAQGLKGLHDSGCYTVVQDPASSIIYGMPGEALRLHAVDEVLSPPLMIERLLGLVERKAL
ncbi:CheB methylesterase domain-containing protein [Heliorestis convoluta]|uniref:protein-glutamate methylesterase n=1 Tax=Heliorestis convoluta TaxID=356322 RepID=A0A5Q2N5F9_9FIRM|nr:CheB methylesterase domain-containing protein [Heliorestis convoluta]QGG47815.1 cheB methylesterase family protein [Heliorestis convoluta]